MTDSSESLRWHKAFPSVAGGECVEIAYTDDYAYMQDSKNPGPRLRVSHEAMRTLLAIIIESGDLDLP